MEVDRRLIEQKAREYSREAGSKHYEEESRRLETLPLAFKTERWEWDDLVWIVRWKSPRPLGHFKKNDETKVHSTVARVLETDSLSEKVRLLTELQGVRVKMASAFLLFMDPENYTVMDWRTGDALHAMDWLPSSIPDDPSVADYDQYVRICREIATEYDVSLRTLDRALWVLGGDL